MKEGTIQHETGLLIWEGATPDNKSLWLQISYPKAKKPFCNYAFKTLERLQAYKENQIKAYKELLELKRARKEAAKATPEKLALVKVGDIFNWTWGYEQTNQDYFQLIELRGQIGIFRELAQELYNYLQITFTKKKGVQNETHTQLFQTWPKMSLVCNACFLVKVGVLRSQFTWLVFAFLGLSWRNG